MSEDNRNNYEETETSYIGSPEDAFSVLGDETRLSILLELADALADGHGLQFSELRKRTGVEDSGRFNYHLDKLSEGFIEKQDGKYTVRPAGMAVASAVYSGTYAEDIGEHTAESTWPCPDCGDPLTIRYESDQLFLTCEEHEAVLGYPTPPGAYQGRSLPDLTEVTVKRTINGVNLARQGICPRCWGETTVEYPVDPDDADEDADYWARISCARCWYRLEPTLGILVSSMPSVRGFYREHGHDLAETIFGPQSVSNTDACQVTSGESAGMGTPALSRDRRRQGTV